MKSLTAVIFLLLCQLLGSNALVLTISGIGYVDYNHGEEHTHKNNPYQESGTTHHEGYANDHRHSIDIVFGFFGDTTFTTLGSSLNINLAPIGVVCEIINFRPSTKALTLHSPARAPPRLNYALIIKKTSVFIV